jgi:hypothetical protein
MDELIHFGIFISMKQYIFYKTVNLKNGKYYYGSHYGFAGDGYLGSGLVLSDAIIKYGKESFIRYDLKIFETNDELFSFEDRFLKLHNLAKDTKCYNVKNAARGGYTLVNYTEDELIQHYKKVSDSLKLYRKNNKVTHSDETKKILSQKKLGENHWIYGTNRPLEVKRKISEKLTGVKHSESRKENMKLSNQNRPMITCPHCGKTAKKHRNMIVYHFDNCKLKN